MEQLNWILDRLSARRLRTDRQGAKDKKPLLRRRRSSFERLEDRLVFALQLDIGPLAISENGGVAQATVTRTGSLTQPLTVMLSSSDVGEAAVPVSVVIAASQASATFNVTGVNDAVADDKQTVTIAASAAGHTGANDTIDVLNDETVTVRAGAASDTVNIGPGSQPGEMVITSGPATPPSLGTPTYFAFSNQTPYQTAGANVSVQSTTFFAVDPTKTYALSGFAKSGDEFGLRYLPNNEQSFGLTAYDIDLLQILPQHVLKFTGATDTALAAPLNPGDSTIHLVNASGWSNAAGAAAGTRGLAWYGYEDSTGTTYADYTYTRNVAMGGVDGLWTPGSVSGNTITLDQPWSGPALAAGTALRNTGVGNEQSNLLLDSTAVPGDFTWTHYAGTFGGVNAGGVDSNAQFRPGTAFVKPTILANEHGTTQNFINWRDVSLTEVPASTTAADLEMPVVDLSVITSSDQRYALSTNSSQWSSHLIRVNTAEQYTLSGRAFNVSSNVERPLGFLSLDIDQKVIQSVHVSKYAYAADTTLAAALVPGATSILINNASGWSNDVWESAETRSVAWYGYADSTGHTYDDYTYTRNVAFDFDDGLWDAGGIQYDASAGAYRILLNNPWSGPTITAGSAIRNATGGNMFNTPDVAPDISTQSKRVEFAVTIGGGTWQSGQRDESGFRPGTAYIQPVYIGTVGNFVIGPKEDDIYGGPSDPTRVIVEPSASGQVAVDLDVLAKGAFGGAATVVIDSVAAPQYGTATVLPGAGPAGRAVIHYSSATSFVGSDVVTYTLRNTATNETLTSSMSIHRLSGNVTPSGIGKLFDDEYKLAAGQTLNANGGAALGILANDGSATNARLVSGPAHGTLSFNNDGTFVYTPAAGFVGTDTFRYEADKAGLAVSGVAVITVFGSEESLSLSRLREIGLGTQNYFDSIKRFPIDATPTNFDANGNQYLSWRVHILPYLGYQALYNQFHLNELWNSAHNLPLAAQMPDVFRSPGDAANSTTTRIQTISGEGDPYYLRRSSTGLLIGPTGGNFDDEFSNTFFAIETAADKAIVWTQPELVNFDANNPLASLGTLTSSSFRAVMADGSTISLPSSIDAETFKGLVTISGGEVVDAGTLRREYAAANGGAAAVQSHGALNVDTNIRQIALAMHNYHDVTHRFPVSGTSTSPNFDANGVPYLSWRVYLLPHLGHQNLFDKFILTEPWYSENNLPLLDEMPDIFRSAGDAPDSTTTRMMSLASTKTGFSVRTPGQNQVGIGLQSVVDGTSQTIMFVEAGANMAVEWTKPEDLVFDINNPLAALGDLSAGSFRAAFFDGHISTLPADISAADFSALATRANREVVDSGSIGARELARTGKLHSGSNTVNNFKNIVLAMLDYEQTRQRFPASSVDASGKPLLSWRVLILPYLEHGDLYDQFKLNEPWDSPHNLALLDEMPAIFRSFGDPWDSTTTRVQTFTGPGAPYATPGIGTSNGPRPQDITDGTSRTIAITETGSGNAVPWTKPTDIPFWLNNPFSPLGDLGVNFVTALFDGSVQTRSSAISMDLLKALITHKGGEDTTNPPTIANAPNFFVYHTAGNTSMNEFGADSFAVVLDKAPTSDVMLSLAASNTSVALLDKTSLTFTPTNWNVPQYVGLRGVDNHVLNNDQSVDITLSVVDEMSDDAYDSVLGQLFSATVRDDDLKHGDYDRNDAVEHADHGVWMASFAASGTGLAADGNRDGKVDAADYVMWRKMLPASVPELPGDYDNSGSVEHGDHGVWTDSFATSGAGLAADGNRDGMVDAADYVMWRKHLALSESQAAGDYNHDGSVEYADHGVWMESFAASGAGMAADGNRDGVVDAADYVMWRKHMSEGGGGGLAADAALSLVAVEVQEPALTLAAAKVETTATDEALAWLAINTLRGTDSRGYSTASSAPLAAAGPIFASNPDALLAILASAELASDQSFNAFEFSPMDSEVTDLASDDEMRDECFADPFKTGA